MVLNISKEGDILTDITNMLVPINDKTIRAYELIADGWKK
jgi:hypothetical protein